MTKQHFIAAAIIIARQPDPTVRHFLAKDFADLFAGENERFDRARFLKACNAD